MARRDLDDDGRKKSAREDQARQEEQEQERQEELERQQDQAQARDAAQDALGNQGVMEMMGVVSTKAGEAGQGADHLERKDTEEIGVDYGGDDVPADAPITMEDLVRSWNPSTQRGQDKEPFREGVGTEDLPDPDPAILKALGPLPALRARDGVFLSAQAAALDPAPVVLTAARLAGGGPLHRVLAFLTAPVRPPLVDPRVVVVRARALAFAALASEATLEALPASDRAPARTFARFLLELASRRRILAEVLDHVAEQKLQLPMAVQLVEPLLATLPTDAPEQPVSPSVEQIEHLRATLQHLTPRTTAATLVPELPAAAAAADPDDDDPLGLDELLAQGHRPDPLAGTYEHLLAAAEKIAVAASRTRVDAAAAVLAVGSVLGPATCRPLAARAAAELDAEAGRALQLLVEVARAIQQRSVPPPGIRNGLRRAAKAVDVCWTQFCGWLAGAVASTVPPPPGLQLPPLLTDDALGRALLEGRTDDARAALAGETHLDAVTARALLARGPDAAEEWHRAAALARAAGRPALARLVDLWAVLAAPRDRGRTLGQALRVQQEAFAAGDDLAFAAVTLALLDLGHRSRPDRVAAQRLEACRRIVALGPTAGLAVLVRWTPDEADPAGDTLAP